MRDVDRSRLQHLGNQDVNADILDSPQRNRARCARVVEAQRNELATPFANHLPSDTLARGHERRWPKTTDTARCARAREALRRNVRAASSSRSSLVDAGDAVGRPLIVASSSTPPVRDLSESETLVHRTSASRHSNTPPLHQGLQQCADGRGKPFSM